MGGYNLRILFPCHKYIKISLAMSKAKAFLLLYHSVNIAENVQYERILGQRHTSPGASTVLSYPTDAIV